MNKTLIISILFSLNFFTNSLRPQSLGWIPLISKNGDTISFNGEISKIIKSNSGNIYMSGNFTDSNQKRQVIEWNRTSLKIVDSSISTLNAMSITDICEDDMGNLFASTLHDASSSQWKVVKWNNTSW